jgi:RNA polymerase sigma factor (sigma-70 family)
MLEDLTPDERAVIVLRYWHDLSIEEIAESTGASPGAVRTRLYRARRRLAAADLSQGAPEAGEWRDEPRTV